MLFRWPERSIAAVSTTMYFQTLGKVIPFGFQVGSFSSSLEPIGVGEELDAVKQHVGGNRLVMGFCVTDANPESLGGFQCQQGHDGIPRHPFPEDGGLKNTAVNPGQCRLINLDLADAVSFVVVFPFL